MKKGDFLWSAYRITEKQKAGKARNIKEKQLKNSRSTVSKQLVALRSSASDNRLLRLYLKMVQKARKIKVLRPKGQKMTGGLKPIRDKQESGSQKGFRFPAF